MLIDWWLVAWQLNHEAQMGPGLLRSRAVVGADALSGAWDEAFDTSKR
jgi:hypothetical protein